MSMLKVSPAVYDRCKNLLIQDYYTYFIIVCLPCNTIETNTWCKVSKTFTPYLSKQDYTVLGDFVYFDFDFGDSIDEIAYYLLLEADDDLLDIIFEFIWSIAVLNGINIVPRYNMSDFWLDLGLRLGYKINVTSKSVCFVG